MSGQSIAPTASPTTPLLWLAIGLVLDVAVLWVSEGILPISSLGWTVFCRISFAVGLVHVVLLRHVIWVETLTLTRCGMLIATTILFAAVAAIVPLVTGFLAGYAVYFIWRVIGLCLSSVFYADAGYAAVIAEFGKLPNISTMFAAFTAAGAVTALVISALDDPGGNSSESDARLGHRRTDVIGGALAGVLISVGFWLIPLWLPSLWSQPCSYISSADAIALLGVSPHLLMSGYTRFRTGRSAITTRRAFARASWALAALLLVGAPFRIA